MTALDEFVPHGEPTHPYDMYELLIANRGHTFSRLEKSPDPIDEDDYRRNWHKLGSTLELAGKLYFETTSVEAKTKEIT